MLYSMSSYTKSRGRKLVLRISQAKLQAYGLAATANFRQAYSHMTPGCGLNSPIRSPFSPISIHTLRHLFLILLECSSAHRSVLVLAVGHGSRYLRCCCVAIQQAREGTVAPAPGRVSNKAAEGTRLAAQ